MLDRIDAGDGQLARAGARQGGQDAQQRRLAGAVRAEDGDEFAAFDLSDMPFSTGRMP